MPTHTNTLLHRLMHSQALESACCPEQWGQFHLPLKPLDTPLVRAQSSQLLWGLLTHGAMVGAMWRIPCFSSNKAYSRTLQVTELYSRSLTSSNGHNGHVGWGGSTAMGGSCDLRKSDWKTPKLKSKY